MLQSDSMSFDNDTLMNDGNWAQIFVSNLKQNNITTGLMSFIKEDNEVLVFPNPSSAIFTINFKNETDVVKICVHDVLGNCVANVLSQNNGNQEINLSNHAKGIYFLELISGSEKQVKKIIVE